MSANGYQPPEPLSPDRTALEILGHTQSTLGDVRQLHLDLCDMLERRDEPARLETVRLTTVTPERELLPSTEAPSRSIGVLNPNPIITYLSITGGSPTLNAEAVSVAPNSLLVLPLAVLQVTIGADPADLAAGDAVVFVLRFATVQPAFLGGTP